MLHLFFSLFPLLVSLAVTKHCPAVTCDALPSNQCISRPNDSQVIVQPCPPNFSCQVTNSTESYCTAKPHWKHYPGNLCNEDSDCVSLSCVSGVCTGVQRSQTCVHEYDCDIALYCDQTTATCQPLLPVAAECTSDLQCKEQSICTMQAFNGTMVCTDYFSVPNGNPVSRVDNDKNGFSYACSSSFAYQSGNDYICADSPKFATGKPVRCESDTDCKDTTGQYQTYCECSYSQEGHAYCVPFPGGEPFTSLVHKLNSLLVHVRHCSTYDRFSFGCYSDRWTAKHYYPYKEAEMLAKGDVAVKVTDSEQCVQSVLLQDYYEFVNATSKLAYAGEYFHAECAGPSNSTCVATTTKAGDFYREYTSHVSECPEGFMCDLYSSNSCIPVPKVAPGGPCTVNTDCQYGTCVSQVCYAFTLGDSCPGTGSCNPGLYCNLASLTCASQVPLGGPCGLTSDCQSLLICGVGNTCQYMYTQPNGTSVADPNECETGFAGFWTPYVCAEVSASKHTPPMLCGTIGQCWSTSTATQNCPSPNLTTSGLQYCPLFPGDPPLIMAIDSYRTLADLYVGLPCSADLRNSADCYPLADRQVYFDYMLNYTFYRAYPSIAGNSDCVLKTWDYTPYPYSDYYLVKTQYAQFVQSQDRTNPVYS